MKKILTTIILTIFILSCSGQSNLIGKRVYVDNLSSFTDSQGQIQVDSLLKLMQLPTVDSLYYILMAKKGDSTISVILYEDFIDSLDFSSDTSLWRLSDGDIFTKGIDTVYIKVLRNDTITGYYSTVNPVVIDDNFEIIKEAIFDSAIIWKEPDTVYSAYYSVVWNKDDSLFYVAPFDSVAGGSTSYWSKTGVELSPTLGESVRADTMRVNTTNSYGAFNTEGQVIHEDSVGINTDGAASYPLDIRIDDGHGLSDHTIANMESGDNNGVALRFKDTDEEWKIGITNSGDFGIGWGSFSYNTGALSIDPYSYSGDFNFLQIGTYPSYDPGIRVGPLPAGVSSSDLYAFLGYNNALFGTSQGSGDLEFFRVRSAGGVRQWARVTSPTSGSFKMSYGFHSSYEDEEFAGFGAQADSTKVDWYSIGDGASGNPSVSGAGAALAYFWNDTTGAKYSNSVFRRREDGSWAFGDGAGTYSYNYFDVGGSQGWEGENFEGGDYDLSDTDNGNIMVLYLNAGSGGDTITLPYYDSTEHRTYLLVNYNVNYSAYVAPQSGDNINSVADAVVELPPEKMAFVHNSSDDFDIEWALYYIGEDPDVWEREKTYGTASFGDSTVTISITQDTWTQITNAGNTLFTLQNPNNNVTLSGDTLFADYAGVYDFTGHLSFQGNNNEIWKVRLVTTNGNAVSCAQKYTSSTDIMTVPVNATLELSVGEGVIMQIYNDTDNDDCTVECGTIKITGI